MARELVLFTKHHISFKTRFLLLMSILVSNQSISRCESFLFLGINYLQILSGFYSKSLSVLNPDESLSDMIVNYIFKVVRYRDLLFEYPTAFIISLYVVAAFFLLFLVFFLIVISKTTHQSSYSLNETICNFGLKLFIFILFNIILDMWLGLICFEEYNSNFKDMKCSLALNITPFVIGLLLVLLSIAFIIFIQFFFIDSLFLSTSHYAKIACKYELFMTINSLFYALFLNLAHELNKEVFFLYNLIISIVLLRFYLKKLIFYDKVSNRLCGLFHLLYVWSAIFFWIFAYVDVTEKGFIFLVSCIIVCFIFVNLRNRLDESIFMSNPYYKIMNKEYLLYYIKTVIDKIYKSDESPEDRATLTAIIQLHIIECPNPNCITKNKSKIYLPLTNEWSDRSQPCFLDKVFLRSFIIAIIRYFISLNFFSPEMIINISLYYLTVIGNHCQALYFYQKVKEMALTTQERFSFFRLKEAITYTLTSKFKQCNEPCYSLEDMNITFFFAYEELARQFHEEVNHDIQLSLEFWKTFSRGENRKVIDFNKVFKVTDQIRIAKSNVEKIWEKIFKLYSGVNDLFLFYLEYVEQINDDDQLKRDLEAIKRKNEISTENIQQNFYNLLFSNETGIVIVNGDRGKEGLIEKVNPECEKLFKYNPDELKGMNISNLMPKILQREHKGFMQSYFEIGEKKVLDKKGYKTFAKDKDNSIILVKLGVKLFPIVNESVYFIAMINAEKVDDIILIDHDFNIQGMSQKLMERLSFENQNFFVDYDIPFYLICKKFVNFYKIFLQGKKKERSQLNRRSTNFDADNTVINNPQESVIPVPDNDGTNINYPLNANMNNDGGNLGEEGDNATEKQEETHDNIEINENIELEYEIKVPSFLIEYSNQSTEKRDNKFTEGTYISVGANYNLINDSMDEEEEDSLMTESAKSLQEGKTPKIKGGVVNDSKSPKEANNNNTGNRQSNEEREFLSKIARHRGLFEESEFSRLEELIEKSTSDSAAYEFKFNFTFEKYQFGDKKIAYIIRCIDNKNEAGLMKSDNDSDQYDLNPRIIQCKKEKIEQLNQLVELNYEEKEELIENVANFMQYSFEDADFQQCLIKGKEDIKRLSRVHGQKKEEALLDDENSSQSSQAGYDSNLCKINRIEEIRGNLIRNVSSFHTLKWIRVVSICFLLSSLLFVGLFYYLFDYISTELRSVSNIHGGFYILLLQISQLTSTLISLRGVYYMDAMQLSIPLNSFTSDKAEYFRVLKNSSEEWYTKAFNMLGMLKKETVRYVEDVQEKLWYQIPMNYSEERFIQDKESFPIAIGQTLSSMHNLLNNPLFTVNERSLRIVDPETAEELKYSAFLAIENAHDVLIPQYLGNLSPILSLFLWYNNSKTSYLYLIVLLYGGVMVILSSLFLYLLLETNNNMGEGFDKVTKISPDKIDDIVKKFETFLNLWKRKDKKLMGVPTDEGEGLNDLKNTTASIGRQPPSSVSRQMGDFSEGTVKKRLTIINVFFVQIPIVFICAIAVLLPLFLLAKEVIDCNVDILSIQAFLFGRFLLTTTSTVMVKCLFSLCKTDTQLDFYSFLNVSLTPSLYNSLKKYDKFNAFYTQNYLLNACGSAYDANTTEYTKCMADPLIHSLNNTDSLMKLISDDVSHLIDELKAGAAAAPPGTFNPLTLYSSNTFNDLETAFYKYVVPVPLRFNAVLKQSFNDKVTYYQIIVLSILGGLTLILLIYTAYLQWIFMTHLIHLLAVSRCIVKIIPTSVITTTQEVENWIEKMNIKVN